MPTTSELLDGTFDRTETQSRQVWVNGILGLEIARMAMPHARDDQGKKISLSPWGTFPDLKEESLAV